jgi:proteic killer suppression protein
MTAALQVRKSEWEPTSQSHQGQRRRPQQKSGCTGAIYPRKPSELKAWQGWGRPCTGIQPKHAKKLRLQLTQLDGATSAADMNLPGWDWHPLKSDLAGHWAVSVSGNWRLTFTFEGTDAILVDYQDYH